MKRIFTIADLCAFEIRLENNMFASCCGKVMIKFSNFNRSIIGYIMDEEYGRWCILLKDNTKNCSKPVIYNGDTGLFDFLLV